MPLGDNQVFTDLLRASPTWVRMVPVVGRKQATGWEENEAYCIVSSSAALAGRASSGIISGAGNSYLKRLCPGTAMLITPNSGLAPNPSTK